MPTPLRTAPLSAEVDARALRALLLECPGLARLVQEGPPPKVVRELLPTAAEPDPAGESARGA